MRPPLDPLYTIPVGDHHTLTLRLPCGRTVDLVVYDGGGVCRTAAAWRLGARTLRVVTAADA